MAKYKRTSFASDRQSEISLERLIVRYLEKVDELEEKEGKVLKDMETMQTAVESLKESNRKRSSRSVRLDEIEEETRRIKAETNRIQEEVREKMEENKRLEEKVDRKRRKEKNWAEGSLARAFGRERGKPEEDEGFKSRALSKTTSAETEDESNAEIEADPVLRNDPKIKIFQDKVKQLKLMERKLKKESEEDMKAAKSQRAKLLEKIEMLEISLSSLGFA